MKRPLPTHPNSTTPLICMRFARPLPRTGGRGKLPDPLRVAHVAGSGERSARRTLSRGGRGGTGTSSHHATRRVAVRTNATPNANRTTKAVPDHIGRCTRADAYARASPSCVGGLRAPPPPGSYVPHGEILAATCAGKYLCSVRARISTVAPVACA